MREAEEVGRRNSIDCVAFDEDRNRTRQSQSADNFTVTRHCDVNLIKKEKTSKVGGKTKRLKADGTMIIGFG